MLPLLGLNNNNSSSKRNIVMRPHVEDPERNNSRMTASPRAHRPAPAPPASETRGATTATTPLTARDAHSLMQRTSRRSSNYNSRIDTVSVTPPSTRPPPHASDNSNEDAATRALEHISMIPREFFVFETNAVLPTAQYPLTQYHSSFKAPTSLWETVVFPALTPQTRQQVLLLRQALEAMRRKLQHPTNQSPSDASQSQRRLVLAYTRDEFRVYSLCFHELVRQIKCICKEQSELLVEIRTHYDDALARVIDQATQLEDVVGQQQRQMGSLMEQQHEHAQRVTDALVEITTLRLQAESTAKEQQLQQQTRDAADRLQRRRWRRQRRRCTCVHSDSGSSSDDSDDSKASSNDDDEAAWRRARHRDSLVVEENAAAVRLQSAYHKYHERRAEQLYRRLALRDDRNTAALEIQRSYRGFKQRQLVRHRRAVVHVIQKRRQEVAAIELLQANVRSYLLKQRMGKTNERRRRSKRPGRHTSDVSDSDSNGSTTRGDAVQSLGTQDELAPAPLDVDAAARTLQLLTTQLLVIGDPSATLGRFLSEFGTLAVAIAVLQTRDNHVNPTAAGSVSTASSDGVRSEHRTSLDERDAVTEQSAGVTAIDGATNVLAPTMEQSLIQIEALAIAFHQSITSLRQRMEHTGTTVTASAPAQGINSSSNGNDSAIVDTESEIDSHEQDAVTVCQSTSTSSLDLHCLPFDVFADAQASASDIRSSSNGDTITAPTSSAALPRPSSASESIDNSNNNSDSSHSDFHLDESLWRPENAAVRLDDHRAQQSRNDTLLRDLLTSRDAKKQFVWLKQFMSDTYDTIVGRLRDAPPATLQRFITTRCALAMTHDEWQQHHDNNDNSSTTSRIDPSLSFQLADILHEHFQCQSGLPHLVESAETHLQRCLDSFCAVDPDVERFRAFLHNERSHDELLFFCVCRDLAARGDASNATTAGMRSPSSAQRQPVFHPDTMRELIELSHALRIAKTLFRVDASDALRAADDRIVEVDNPVYRRFTPSTAFDQLSAVLSAYYVDASLQQQSPAASTNVATSPRGASCPLSSIVRPSNVHQFHSKQFNAVAARSPLVRQRHQAAPQQQQHNLNNHNNHNNNNAITGPSVATLTQQRKWLHFDDVVELLRRYQREMHHFHLFTRWTRELFATATASSAASSKQPVDGTSPPVLLSELQFIDALVPRSLGPNERELVNIFHNALKQRSLQQWMPPRVFTSIVLLMLRNGLLSVSTFRPHGGGNSDNRVGSSRNKTIASHRGESEEKRWQQLAACWRCREANFEQALEAIYDAPAAATDTNGDNDATAAATRLLELRNELFTLFMSSSGAENLARAEELYELIAARLAAQTTTVTSTTVASDRIDLSRAYLLGDDDDSDSDSDTDGNAKHSSQAFISHPPEEAGDNTKTASR